MKDTVKEERIYLHVNKLPELPVNCVIVGAVLGYVCRNYDAVGITELNLEMRELTPSAIPSNYSTWIKNLSWNTKPSHSGTVLDYVTSSDSTEWTYLTWNLTSTVQKWYEDSTSNKGLVMMPEADSGYGRGHAAIVDINGYGSVNAPKLVVFYRNTVGVEDYYTYRTESMDNAGTAYIGDFTNQLTVVHDDLSWETAANSYSLLHVYNTANAAWQFTNNEKAGIHTCDFSGMMTGAGWKLSAQQTVISTMIGSTEYLVYNDADGTEHYFQYSSTESAWLDEDGLGLQIKKTAESGNTIYTMTDTDAYHTWVFHNGYLISITDSNGNAVYIAYNNNYSASGTSWKPAASGTNRIVQITAVNHSGGTTVLAAMGYTDNYLTSIQNYVGRTTRFSYTADSVKKLSEITYQNGTKVQYAYDGNGRMSRAYDAESRYGLTFTHKSNSHGGHTVSQVREFAVNDAGETLYGNGFDVYKNSSQLSSCRFYGTDHTAETSDDIMEYFNFDFQGKTVNAYEKDASGTIVGVSMADYTKNSGTSKTNNRIVTAGALGMENVNLLGNSGTEKNGYSWAKQTSYETEISSINAAVRPEYTFGGVTVSPRTGNTMIKMFMDDVRGSEGQKVGMYQDMFLLGNKTYTFSGYINTRTMTRTFGGGVYLCVMDQEGRCVAKSDVIDYMTSEDIDDGWEKVSVTYTIKGSGGLYKFGVFMESACYVACCDDLQLEISDTASTTNLIQEGSFEENPSYYWDYDGINANIPVGTSYDGSSTLRIMGMPSAERHVSQTIPVSCPGDTTFILSGWGKAQSVNCPSEAEDASSKRMFGFIAALRYTDGTTEDHKVAFNSDISDWQYVSKAVVPKEKDKTVQSIEVKIAYDHNANTAYFDHIVLAKEPVETYSYDKDGNLIDAKHGSSNKTAYEYYDKTHLLKSYTDATGVTTTLTYEDKTHNVLTSTTASVKITNTYNPAGKVTSSKIQNSSGSGAYLLSNSTYSTDLNYLLTVTNGSGQVTKYHYETDMNRLLAVENGAGTFVRYVYVPNTDRVDNTYIDGVVSVTNVYRNGFVSAIRRKSFAGGTPAWQRYNFGLDAFGNTTKISVQGSSDQTAYADEIVLAGYTYDSGVNNGNLIRMTYGNGDTVNYSYDQFDRVIKETYNDGTSLHYRYSSEGDLSEQYVTNSAGKITERYAYVYDSLGRLIRSCETDGSSMVQRTEHLYDTADRLTSQSWQMGDTAYTERFTYDSNGNLSVFQPGVGSQVAYTYDGINRLSSQSNGIYTKSYGYKNLTGDQTTLLVDSLTYQLGNAAAAYHYTYDAIGNIKSQWKNSEAAETYNYDVQNQLIKVCDSAAQTETTYTYDTAGNILKRTVQNTNGNTSHEDTYTYGNGSWLDMLTAYNGHAIAYEGQTLNSETSVLGTAVSGNPVSYYNGTRWNMTWKKGRQLAAMSKDGTNISYTYDLNGIRKSKTVNGTAYSYITQNGQVVRQTWGSNVLDIIYDNNSVPYAMVYNGTAYYYILNQQGDVVSFIDANKNTVAAYDYDAWGKVLSATGNLADVNPIRYRGYYYDTETGLYYLRSRYYDPEICRFINADDAEYADLNTNTPEETNLFAYVGNNPVMRMDEDGCLSNGWKLAITGAILVASVAVIVATGGVASGPVMCVAVSASQGAITGAVSGAVSGAAVSAVTGAVKHRMATGSWKGAGSAALKKAKQGAIDGAFSDAISGAVSGALHPSTAFFI